MIRLKRVYEAPANADGTRLLVERLWPRGMKKESLQLDGWLREVWPSQTLRKWYAHQPERWVDFQRRYRAELDTNPAGWQPILDVARKGTVTLLFSARDVQRNSAVLLAKYLESKLERS
jgi:uncharacterized protein YeaO (DUF488 family)